MLTTSYVIAAFVVLIAGAYYYRRFKGYISTTSMFWGLSLVLYGPAYFLYMLYYANESVIYRQLVKSPYFDSSVISLNLSISVMYIACMAGIEVADKIAPNLHDKLSLQLQQWSLWPPARDREVFIILIGINALLSILMIIVSIKENHLGVVWGFYDAAQSVVVRDEYRLNFSGSKIYLYRVLLSSIAPFFMIWGLIEGRLSRSNILLIVSIVLLFAILLGRLDLLSRAPVALLFVQLLFALLLCYRNKVTWRVFTAGVIIVILIFYPLIQLTIPETAKTGTAVSFFFRRTFFISNEVLLEYFTAIPYYLPHTWGANIRLIAFLSGAEFKPAYTEVSYLWRSASGSISNAMFIADAWADFSFFGVAVTSVVIAAICRFIDLRFMSGPKTSMVVALLASMFIAVFHILTGAAQTAMLSGGLITLPIIAICVSKLSSLLKSAVAVRSSPPEIFHDSA